MEASIIVLVFALLIIGGIAIYAHLTKNVHIVVVAAFFASGASGLVLENLWTRMLRHVFGSTTLAISTVLTAFMGGLALGSYLFGRYADRIKKPLVVYAIAEGIVGLYALIVPFIVQDLYPYVNAWMWANFETSYAWLSVLRFGFSALVLIPPATLMGATLPLLARHFISQPEGMKQIGLNVGILYTLNTMGAIAGTFVSGFVLLPEVGQRATNYVAAAIDIVLCLSILLLRKRLLAEREGDKKAYTESPGFLSVLSGIFVLLFSVVTVVACAGFRPTWFIIFVLLLFLVGGMLVFRGVLQGIEAKKGDQLVKIPPVQMYPISRAARAAALLTFFFSGVAAMNYQVIWSRALAMVIGSSVYSFTIILLAFLVGIAIGSAFYSSIMHRVRNPVLHLAFVKLYVGMMAVLNFIVMDDLPFWFARLVVRNVTDYHEHIGTVQFFMFCIAALAIIPCTIGMGAGFPLTIKIATAGHERVGRDVGNIYAINTIGCIIGSFCSAFIFVPGLSSFAYEYVTDFSHGYGLQYAVYLSLLMNFSMAVTLILLMPKRPELAPVKWVFAPLIPAWLAVVVAFVPGWNLAHMTLGNFRLSVGRSATDPDQVGSPDMVFYFDGMSTTVSVERWGRHLALKNNGKVDASNGEDMSTQIMVAGFPLVFHPDGPENLDVAVIGFGSGTTLGTTSQFPVNRIDIVELEPSISGPPGGYWTRESWEEASEAEQAAWRSTIDYRRERAGARFFTEINHDPWTVPWVNVINNDGRNYLASTSHQYDVVISEPSNPWITGVSDLFTVDHFHAASQALAPHGIFCQWVQLYELSLENIEAVFRAIAGVFPYMVVFAAEDLSSDTVILASYDPIPFDYERVRTAMEVTTEEGEETVRQELERAHIYSPFDAFSRVILASREEVLAFSSRPFEAGRRCPDGMEDQSDLHLEPIGRHHRGVCVAEDGEGGRGQCATAADCEGSGVQCLSGPMMGVCQDANTVCTTDADCRGEDDEAIDARCQVCAVELNTDDNSRIEFNAPRDLIGFEAHEGTVSQFYATDWPYGRLCREPGSEDNCLLENMGEGDEAAQHFANLGLSLLGSGKINEARQFIEHSAQAGDSPRTELAVAVYGLLLGEGAEPEPEFGDLSPPDQLNDSVRDQLVSTYQQVRQQVERGQWQEALQGFDRMPSGILQAAGSDLAYMAAYVLYRNAVASEQRDPRYSREAGRILHDIVRLDEEYLTQHPEIYFFLARCYLLENAFNEARRYMVRFVEMREGTSSTTASDEEETEGGITNGEGTSPKDTHPDYVGTDRAVELHPAAEAADDEADDDAAEEDEDEAEEDDD